MVGSLPESGTGNMKNPFKKATRRRAYLKLGITGGPGTGKTYSGLRLATGLAAGQPIAGIDTENGSMSLYAETFNFDVVTLEPPFTDDKFVEAIEAAVAGGYGVVIIDSFSHAWEAVLDYKTSLDSKGGNSYTNWGTAGKKFKSILVSVLQSPIHVICCLRSKMQYVLETDLRGKQVPRKIGMEPIARDGADYEFSTVFDIGSDHCATVSKDRTNLFMDQHFQVTEATGAGLLGWLNSAAAPEPKPTLQEQLVVALEDMDPDDVQAFLVGRKVSDSVLTVPDEYAERSLRRLPELKTAINKFRQEALEASDCHTEREERES
jgi:hypothetical protein